MTAKRRSPKRVAGTVEAGVERQLSLVGAGLVDSDPDGLITSDAWVTQRELALALGRFGTDPCTNPRSHIVAALTYQLERGEDGLTSAWVGSVWCNGPYSDPLPWCRRLAGYHGPWSALWKLDTTTEWWATLVEAGAQWAPFRSRLKFERPDKPPLTANFASALLWRDWEMPAAVRPWLWLPGDAVLESKQIGLAL